MKNNMRRAMADCIYMTYVVQGLKADERSAAGAADAAFPLN